MTKSEKLEQLELILLLKGQGQSDAAIKKRLSLSTRDYSRRMALIEEDETIKKRATQLCIETLLRMQDTRNRLMTLYASLCDETGRLKDSNDFKKALDALAEVGKVDERIPRACLQLGFMPMPEQAFLVTDIRTGDAAGRSYDDLQRTYVLTFGEHAQRSVN